MMINSETLAQNFVDVWNETEPAARRTAVAALWAIGGRHLMGATDVCGRDALEARVKASHERSVVQGGNRFRLAGAVQALPGALKFRWDMANRASGQVTAAGVGFLLLDDDGKISIDYLFTES